MISYAQNGEDVLLERLFRDVAAGTYIDVGANDPVDLSVTKHFYDRGWRGINIEPGSAAYARLCTERPRDCNLHMGLGDIQGEVNFYELPQHSALSTFSAEQAELYRGTGQEVVERSMRVGTLAQVCAEHIDGLIHFLSIDVEGYERQVLQGADWTRWRPAVVLIEATKPNTTAPTHEGWEPLLLQADYRFAYFDGLNRFYVRAESLDLLEVFRTPVNVCDNYVCHAHQRQVDALHAALQESQANLRQTEQCLGERHVAVEALLGQLVGTQAQLANTQTQLINTQTQLINTQTELINTQTQLVEVSSARAQVRRQLEAARLAGSYILRSLSAPARGAVRLLGKEPGRLSGTVNRDCPPSRRAG